MSVEFWIDARDKPGLFYAMIKEFSNRGRVSFEGYLQDLELGTIPGAINKAEKPLGRATRYPRLDFIVVPLNPETVPRIWKEVNEKDHLAHEGIIHVQVEHDGKLVFCAFDNFDKNCTVAYESVPQALLDRLKTNGVIRGYEKVYR